MTVKKHDMNQAQTANQRDLLDQLGDLSRSRKDDPHLSPLDDLQALSEDRATPQMRENLNARAQESEAWSAAVEAAQPISATQQEDVIRRVTSDLNPNVVDLSRWRSKRAKYVAAFSSVAAAASFAFFIAGPKPTQPLPDYSFQVSYGPADHSQFIELSRTKDGQIIDNGRSRFKIQLTPETKTTADLAIQAWSVGKNTEKVSVEAFVSDKGGIQLTLESQRNLDRANFLLVTLRHSNSPELRTPDLCTAPTCRAIRIPIHSNS